MPDRGNNFTNLTVSKQKLTVYNLTAMNGLIALKFDPTLFSLHTCWFHNIALKVDFKSFHHLRCKTLACL